MWSSAETATSSAELIVAPRYSAKNVVKSFSFYGPIPIKGGVLRSMVDKNPKIFRSFWDLRPQSPTAFLSAGLLLARKSCCLTAPGVTFISAAIWLWVSPLALSVTA